MDDLDFDDASDVDAVSTSEGRDDMSDIVDLVNVPGIDNEFANELYMLGHLHAANESDDDEPINDFDTEPNWKERIITGAIVDSLKELKLKEPGSDIRRLLLSKREEILTRATDKLEDTGVIGEVYPRLFAESLSDVKHRLGLPSNGVYRVTDDVATWVFDVVSGRQLEMSTRKLDKVGRMTAADERRAKKDRTVRNRF